MGVAFQFCGETKMTSAIIATAEVYWAIGRAQQVAMMLGTGDRS